MAAIGSPGALGVGNCDWPGGANADLGVQLEALDPPIGTIGDTAGIAVGAPFRAFRRAEYGIFQQDGRWWLGRKLGSEVSLPWVPLGDSTKLELGDPVLVFGYPSEGSERSRTPIILTRGSVAGLESIGGAPRWIKTDAWIGLGHSGGSLVDTGMRLVGIPAATLGAGEELGLAVPISLVPAAWKLRILKDQPK